MTGVELGEPAEATERRFRPGGGGNGVRNADGLGSRGKEEQ